MSKMLSDNSVKKVIDVLKVSYPLAITIGYIRNNTGVGDKSIRIICDTYKDNIKVISTSSGDFYKWVEK